MTGKAIYKLPNAQYATRIEGEVVTISRLKDITEQQGYLVAPFDSLQHPLLLISAGTVEEVPLVKPTNKSIDIKTEREVSEYTKTFKQFHNAVVHKDLHKVVLSRTIMIEMVKRDNEEMFWRACKKYPQQMVTMFDTLESGLWLVITPEILVKAEGRECATMALAGTMPANNNEKWSKKNKREQQIVREYIRNKIEDISERIEEQGPYSVIAGSIQHLRSDYRFCIRKDVKLGALLDRLHPTPAVCGLPKDEAFQFINKYEKYDRRYYSGFSGPLNINGKSIMYVTLRCAEIEKENITLYAGGGIMPESEMESEELETRLKMQTIKAII